MGRQPGKDSARKSLSWALLVILPVSAQGWANGTLSGWALGRERPPAATAAPLASDLIPPAAAMGELRLKGKVTPMGAVTLKVDGEPVTIGADGTWTKDVSVNTSPRLIPVEARDPTGKVATRSVSVSGNRPPQIRSFSPAASWTMEEGQTQGFLITASDPDGDPLDCFWVLDGMAVGDRTSQFAFTPPAGSVGEHVLAVAVSDGRGGMASQRWGIAVLGGSGGSIVPRERLTVWNPGLRAVGGIPIRTVLFTTLSPRGGTLDDTANIQSALDKCPENQVVKLNPGNFIISGDGLTMNRSGITLRGSGPAKTRLLKKPQSNSMPVILIGNRWSTDKFLSSHPLAAHGAKGSKNITLAAAPNPILIPGEIVHLDQMTNPNVTVWSPDSPPGHPSRGWFCRTNRPVAQIVEVESASGTSVTFKTPLHIDFLTAYKAELSRYGEGWRGPQPVPATKWTGVEDLYLEKGNGGNIDMNVCAYCWVKKVESAHSTGSSIGLGGSYRCEVRDSYFHTSDNPNPGGAGYLVDLYYASSDNLVENNIVWFGNKVMVMRASGGGNVIGYNYMEDALIGYQYNWVESGLNASHMTTPHFELFEGNQCFNFDGESTWGNSVYISALRNHLTTRRRDIGKVGLTDEGWPRAVSLWYGHWWYSIVGNVLGEANMNPWPHSAYEYEDFYPWNANPVGMWKLGTGYNWDKPDPLVSSRLIRHGNFDYVTKTQKWDESIANRDLPKSLYLSGKPAFFGSYPWPWVEPGGSTKVFTLPARARFDAGAPFADPP